MQIDELKTLVAVSYPGYNLESDQQLFAKFRDQPMHLDGAVQMCKVGTGGVWLNINVLYDVDLQAKIYISKLRDKHNSLKWHMPLLNNYCVTSTIYSSSTFANVWLLLKLNYERIENFI